MRCQSRARRLAGIDGRCVEAFIRGLPKAELHLHIEGTMEPELLFRLADRNGVALRFASEDEVREAYEFTDLQTFLDVYYEAAKVLVTEADFYDLTVAYLERAAADGVRHVEIFFDPQTHTERGVSIDAVIQGIHRALEDGRERLGITSGLILCFLRHLSEAAALETFESALPHLEKLVGVGLDSSELGHPPEKFAIVFGQAREVGLRVVAHGAEEGPPSYVTGALDILGAERIDHGIRAEEDEELIARLIEQRIPLTMCPLSNVKLRVFDRIEDHSIKRLLDRGVVVTVNSDDPAYFGGYVGDNYLAIQQAFDLTREDLWLLAGNSIRASFLEVDDKQLLLNELDAFVQAHESPTTP